MSKGYKIGFDDYNFEGVHQPMITLSNLPKKQKPTMLKDELEADVETTSYAIRREIKSKVEAARFQAERIARAHARYQ